MRLCEVRSLRHPGLSRLRTFAAQDVSLKYPSRSWSGVRAGDGMVVFAIRARDVLADDLGCRCLLWSPAAAAWMDHASMQERLEHCGLAVHHGGAEGFLVRGDDAAVDPSGVIALAVEKAGEDYWALWGSVTRTEGARRFARGRMPDLEACLAA